MELDRTAMNKAEGVTQEATPVEMKSHTNLADFLMASPLAGAELDLERRIDYPRPVELLDLRVREP